MLNPRSAPRIALALLLSAFAAACDSGTEPEPRIHVMDLTLEAVGDAAQLDVRVDGEDATARWESLAPDLVAVTPAGVATAVSHGIATVRAEINGRIAEGEVTVLPPVDVQISELAVVTDPGGSQGTAMRLRNLGGRGYYRLEFWKLRSDGSPERIMYHTADAEAPVGLNITYAHFGPSGTPDWVLAFSREPVSLEAVRTSCVRMDGQAGCPSDTPPPEQPAVVDSVFVSPGAMVFTVGQTVQYEARAFANGVEVAGRTVHWHTSSPGIISLSPSGLAQALAPGYGEVEATVDGISSSVGLTVMTPEPEPEAVAHLIIDTGGLPIRMWAGQVWHVGARVLNSQFQPIASHTVTWSVQDPMVATVDSVGRLTAVGAGTTVVTATAGGKSASVSMKSYIRPADSAELAFFGTLSDSSAAMIQRSVDTTWVDAQGVEHPAFITFHAGHLSLDWSGASPSYEQRITMRTFTHAPGSLQMVDESEYVDTGSLTVLYDWWSGDHIYQMTSAVTPGLTYQGRYSLPGEVVVMQPIGSIAAMKYYFKLQ